MNKKVCADALDDPLALLGDPRFGRTHTRAFSRRQFEMRMGYHPS